LTIFLGPEAIESRMSPGLALRAMEDVFALEASGQTRLPPRIDIPSGRGFLRVMAGVLDDVMGLKVMTLSEGVGTRYFVLLYDIESGALLAIFDADELTRYRTAATTALAGRCMVEREPRHLGMLGSGFEAVGELRALAAMWPLEEVSVFSPSPDRRKRFAESMQLELGINVRSVDSTIGAVEDQDVIVLATKSKEPVLDGKTIPTSSVVLSIGSTRPDLRELDLATLARAGTIVGDDPSQLQRESGDIADAIESGVLDQSRIVALHDVCANRAQLVRDDERDLLVFKSVGTALQDLAIARTAYRHAVTHGYGFDMGDLTSLKAFASGR
jgi:alanine dehydrogenase